MGLFSRGPKFSEMQTEEERYFASPQRGQAFADAASRRANDRNTHIARQAAEERAAATQERRSRVKKVGTLRRAGRNKWITEGWQIDGVSDYDHNTRHENTLGGLTVHDLCALSHGPRCNCTRRG